MEREMTEMDEKQPIVLDITRGSGVSRATEVQVVIDRLKADRLQVIAERLGGFSVMVVAEAGAPYRTIFSTVTQSSGLSQVLEVPEGKVIIGMQNTAQPKTPTDLSRLYESLRNETEE